MNTFTTRILFKSHLNHVKKQIFRSLLTKRFSTTNNVIEYDGTQTLEQISATSPNVIIDFYADWCAPCKALKPIITEKVKGYKDVVLVKINIDNYGDIASEFDVEGIPYVVHLKNGKKVNELVGMNKNALENMFSSIEKL
jgi:thioredoxin 1